MKKIALYILILSFILSGCARELGTQYTIERQVDGMNLKTLDSAYLYGKVQIDVVNKVNYYFDSIDVNTYKTINYAVLTSELFDLDSIEILNVGYCWLHESEGTVPSINKITKNYVIYGDSILKDTLIDNKKFTAIIDGLDMDSLYYARSFVVAKDLRTDRIDTGYNQAVVNFRTLMPEDFWVKKADFWGSARTEAVSFVINNEAYIYGGYNGLTVLSDTWKYNSEFDTWQQVAGSGSPPKGRKGGVAFVIFNSVDQENQAWVGLGETDPVNHKVDSTFVYYTTQTNSWRSKYRPFPENLVGAIAFTLKVGDEDVGFIGYGENKYGVITSELYYYRPDHDYAGTTEVVWDHLSIESQMTARKDATVTVLNNLAFVCGGENNQGNLNDFWKFDATSLNYTWEQLSPMPGEPRANAVSFSLEYTKNSIDYQIVCVGTGRIDDGLTNDFYKFDFSTQTWSQISWLGGPEIIGPAREGAVAFDIFKAKDEYGLNVKNRGYVVTGTISSGNKVKDSWEYYP